MTIIITRPKHTLDLQVCSISSTNPLIGFEHFALATDRNNDNDRPKLHDMQCRSADSDYHALHCAPALGPAEYRTPLHVRTLEYSAGPHNESIAPLVL